MDTVLLEEIRNRFPLVARRVGQRIVVKYGGAAMEREEVRESVCAEIAALTQLGIQIIVVHGGGKEISRFIERIGLTPHFVEGLRVTDAETMTVTEMVLSGSVNKDLVSRISRNGAKALGLSGRDAHTLEAVRLLGSQGQDLGQTGDVTKTDPQAIEAILAAGLVPVVSPVGETIHGEPLNLNADYAAAAIAGALGVKSCVFLTDVAGVKKDGQVLPLLTAREVAALIETGVISGGMIPKVQCAIRAVRSGCPTAIISDASQRFVVSGAIAGDTGCGTQIIGQ